MKQKETTAPMTEFYAGIEPGVRDIVKLLRDNGVNTTCSCEHSMTIEFDTCNDSSYLDIIYLLLFNNGYRGFRIDYSIQCPPDGFVVTSGTIYLNKWLPEI